MKKKKIKEPLGVCCDEAELTCKPCSFEDSVKVDLDDELNNER